MYTGCIAEVLGASRIYTGYIVNELRTNTGSCGCIARAEHLYCVHKTDIKTTTLRRCSRWMQGRNEGQGSKGRGPGLPLHPLLKRGPSLQPQPLLKRGPTLPLHPCPLQRGHLPWLMSLNPLVLMLTTVLLLTKARAKAGQLTSKQRRSKGRLLPLRLWIFILDRHKGQLQNKGSFPSWRRGPFHSFTHWLKLTQTDWDCPILDVLEVFVIHSIIFRKSDATQTHSSWQIRNGLFMVALHTVTRCNTFSPSPQLPMNCGEDADKSG